MNMRSDLYLHAWIKSFFVYFAARRIKHGTTKVDAIERRPGQSLRRWGKFYWLAPLLAAAAAEPACAQSLLAFRFEAPQVDQNNVDVTSGYFVFYSKSLTIGEDSGNPLTYMQKYNLNAGWSSGLGGRLNYQQDTQTSWKVTASLGDALIQFTGYSVGTYADNKRGYVKAYDANGAEIAFPWGTNQIVSPASFVWTMNDGTKVRYIPEYIYNSSFPSGGDYMVDKVTYPSGLTWRYGYKTVTGLPSPWPTRYRLQSVASNAGYALRFGYQSDTFSSGTPFYLLADVTAYNAATEYCDPVADHCTFANAWPKFTFSGDYSNGIILDDRGIKTEYAFTIGSNTATHKFKTNGSATYDKVFASAIGGNYVVGGVAVETNTNFRVSSFTDNGTVWNYAVTDVRDGNGSRVGLNVAVNAPDGSISSYATSFGQLKSATDGLNRTTTYSWWWRRPYTLGRSEGNSLAATYDDRGNMTKSQEIPKTGSGLTPREQNYTYEPSSAQAGYASGYVTVCNNPTSCNKPLEVKDAAGSITNYAYSPVHGGVLSEMAPAPTSGAARPLTLTTYAQRYAWTRSASGSLVQSPDPLWTVQDVTVCQTVAGSNTPVCDTAATTPKTVTTYEYGVAGSAEALLVKGVAVTSGGTTLRTCFGYDANGRKISTTKPNAGLGACP